MSAPGDESGVVATFDPPVSPADLPDDPDEIVARIFDPDLRGELYPLYHRLREVAPVHRSSHPMMPGGWLVSRLDDCLGVYRNPRAVSDPRTAEHFNHGGAGGAFYQMLRQMMLFLESEQHARVRRIVVSAFTPRALANVAPLTQATADRLLDDVADSGEMDMVEDFAYQLPIRVIATLLGVPEEGMAVVGRHAYDFARGSEPATEVDDRTRRADAAAEGFAAYFGELVEQRRARPGDDVLSALVQAEDADGRLTREQVVATAVLLMQAGHETTTDMLGNSLVALFRHPEQLERLRREPDLTRSAVEELLRFDATNQMNNRLLLDDTDIGGVNVPAGEQAVVMIGAANRDPVHFDAPDVLRLDRDIRQHVAFGFGAYYCVGATLARTELQVALRTLLDRLPNLRPARDSFTWRSTLRNRGPAELRVAWG
ncbi:MAG: cytochrome P450 [Acidimicrobiales bacterium]|nr:cytochrome P450 [Acidimicrobiales bacterium]